MVVVRNAVVFSSSVAVENNLVVKGVVIALERLVNVLVEEETYFGY